MSSPLSNSDMAYQRLNQKIQETLKAGKTVDRARCERWLDLFALHNNETDLRNTPFVSMYNMVKVPGIVNRWDEALLDAYANHSRTQFLTGCVLTTVFDLRINDGAWRQALWNDDDLREGVLQTNMQHHQFFESAMLKWLERVHNFRAPAHIAIHSFGPWRLASQWYEDARQGLYHVRDDALDNTRWLYTPFDSMHKNRAWLQEHPDSLGGALFFYVHTLCKGLCSDKTAPIFDMPAPTKDSTLFFLALSHFKESFEASPTVFHAWQAAQASWPEPCHLLEVFLGMHSSMHHARQSMQALAQAYDAKSSEAQGTLTLPPLDLDRL